MRRKKEDYVVIAFAVILLLIVGAIVYISFTVSSSAPQEKSPRPSPTVIPTTFNATPTPVSIYNEAMEEKMAEKIIERTPLSQPDAAAKETTLNTILRGANSGIVYQTEDVRVEYVQSGDIFMAEIISENVVKAKEDTNVWFRNQGLSQQGICDLPLMFYLDLIIAEKLKERKATFSPLPPGC